MKKIADYGMSALENDMVKKIRMQERIRENFIKNTSPGDPLVGTSEDFRRSVISGKRLNVKAVHAYEERALHKVQKMGRLPVELNQTPVEAARTRPELPRAIA